MIEQSSIEEIFQKYGEMLYKICIVMLKKTYDAEDTVQDVLIKYMTKILSLKLMNMKRHG